MLTSLSQLDMGNQWPPENLIERRQMLHNNKALFRGKHADIYKDSLSRVLRIVDNFDQIVSYDCVINYQKKISIKTADLLIGETPAVKADDQNTIDAIVKNTNLWNTAYQLVLDQSRYGDGIMRIYKDAETNQGQIDVVPTEFWYPVVDPYNIKKVNNHVIAHVFSTGHDVNRQEYVRFEIHYKGKYETRVHELNKGKIGRLSEAITTTQTGLSDFSIVIVSNITTADCVYGISDYEDVDSIVCELIVRLSQVIKILDKHADPSFSAPLSSLQQDPMTGEYRLRLGNCFIVNDKNAPDPKYITFDGELKSNFTMIETLMNQLYIMSELGSLFLGGDTSKLGNVSGTALRKMAMNALAKINRFQMRLKPGLQKAILLCSELGGKGINRLTEVAITFKDGLPNDIKELAEIAAIRTGKAPTMSIESAIKYIDDCDDEEAKEEMERMSQDKPITPDDDDNDTTPPMTPEKPPVDVIDDDID